MERKELSHDTIVMFRRVDTAMKRYMDRKVSHTGVYPTQHRLLMELNCNPCCSQVELAEKFDVSAAAIAVSLKKLEKGGYITRLADREDNRVNQVSITERGKDVIHKSHCIFQEADKSFFEGMEDQEIEQLKNYLERVYENMSAMCGRLDREE